MSFSNGMHRVRGVRRFGQITRVLVRNGLGGVVDRLLSRSGSGIPKREPGDLHIRTGYPAPVRIRKALEELGPSFIKLGQLMSTRADLFPTETIDELKKLQDRVPPVSYEEIRRVVETELNVSIENLFDDFSREPIAAASVAQVHRARLKTGEEVAVKVVRPGIGKIIRDDIRLMYYFAEKIEKNFELGEIIGAVNLVKEFERVIFKELDMFIEAGNMERFAANFRESDEIVIPGVYWEFTAKSVLVMDYLGGFKMDQVSAIEEAGIEPRHVAMIGLRSFSKQLMEHGFFHADPHPANTIVLPDGRVGLVDFGIIGYLDEEVMRQIANLFLGYAEHDYDMVMDALWDAGLIDESSMDLDAFRSDLKDMSEPFYGRSLKNISVKDVYDQVMQVVLKYRIRLPRNLLLLLKTFIQTEALGKILDSDASILEVTRPYAKRLLQRGYEAKKIMKTLKSDFKSMGGYLRSTPKLLTEILRALAAGKQRVELWHTGFDTIAPKFEKGVNRLTVGMIIAASTIAAALVLNSSQKVIEVDLHFLGLNGISLTGLLGITGYTIATLLGVWLIVSIIRSGKL